MTEPPVTYYVRLGPNDTVDDPKALLRRASTPAYPSDQALRRDGGWHPTETLARAERGELELADRIVEISADHAAELARQWRAGAERLERELAAQGRGELGFRVARAVDAVRDEHDMPIITEALLDESERISVRTYLTNAPIAVASWGYGLDPFDPAHLGAVPLSIRTDGLWVWSESLAYFASAHGIRPEPDLMAHMRDRQYRIPEVQHDVLLRVGRLLMGYRHQAGDTRPPQDELMPDPNESPRLRKLMELAKWHDEWSAAHENDGDFRPEEHPRAGSDYNVHHIDVDPSGAAEAEFMMKASKIMGLDPETGLPTKSGLAVVLPVARSRDEAHLYMDLHPCEVCGSVEVAWAETLVERAGEPVCRYAGGCADCGTEREFVFGVPRRPVLPAADEVVRFGGPEPSQLLDAGQWLAVADMCAQAGAPLPGASGPDAVARHSLAVALAAIDEVLKFIPPGIQLVPDAAFWSPAGRELREASPSRFEVGRLTAVRDAYRELAERERL